jgi:hypothetical protein
MSKAIYPTPSEIRAVLQASVTRSIGATPIAAYLKHRYTWDGDGYDVVAEAIVIWKKTKEQVVAANPLADWREDRHWGYHSSATIRSTKHGLDAPLAGGHYELNSQTASNEASERARGWGWIDLRPDETDNS